MIDDIFREQLFLKIDKLSALSFSVCPLSKRSENAHFKNTISIFRMHSNRPILNLFFAVGSSNFAGIYRYPNSRVNFTGKKLLKGQEKLLPIWLFVVKSKEVFTFA